MNKLAFVNGKGGCGKTHSIFHIAGVLSKQGEKVLVIDYDKQRNVSDTLLMNTEMPEHTVLDFMLKKCEAKDATGKALFQTRGNATPKYYNVDVLISDVRLEDEALLKKIDRDYVKETLNEFIKENEYTWVLVDMPPSNKVLNEICFGYVVDYIIIPFSSDIYSVSGYGDIIESVAKEREVNPSLNILGVYLARYMRNCAVDKYIREELLDFDTFIDIQIPLAADVREGVMFGRPISYYKLISDSKSAFEELVEEIRNRIRNGVI